MALDIGAVFKIKAGVEGQQQLDRLNRSLKDTEGQGGRLGSMFSGMRGAIAGAFSVAAVYQFGKAVIGAASEAEQASNRINAVLRATGYSAGLARFEIDELADSLAISTQFDDESIRNAAAQFLKFGNIQGDVFKEGIRLSADLAALMGTDVVSAAQTVGKALQSPAEGLMTLERQLGKLDPAQKKNIENLVETGRLAEAQAAVLEILRGKIGGVAEEMNTGLLAGTTGVKKAWDEFLETLGKTSAVKVPVESFFTFLKDSLNDIRRIVEDESWTQKLKGIFLWSAGFRNFDLSPAQTGGLSPEQRDEQRRAQDAAQASANADSNARLLEWSDKKAEELQKKAKERAKKDAEDNKRLLDEGQRGWVAYAEEIFRIADEENLALAKLADERLAYEEKMRKLDIDGWVAHAEEVFRLADEENLAMAKIADDGKKQFAELQRAVEGWGRGAAQAFTDWAFGAKGNIKDVVRTMLQEFSTMMVYKNVFSPLATMGSNWLTSVIPKFFHGGGVVGAGGSGGRAVSPLAFAGAPRMHGGGVAGLRSDEVPAILQKGETVLPRGGAGGGVNVAVTVNMAEGTTQATGNSDGGMQLGKMIGDTVRGILIDEQRPGGLIARA